MTDLDKAQNLFARYATAVIEAVVNGELTEKHLRQAEAAESVLTLVESGVGYTEAVASVCPCADCASKRPLPA